MGTESIVLYKLIVLYMLDRVNFTLTNSQISDFVLEKGYTNYFTLQEAINGLIESEFVYDQELCDAINVELPEDATAEQVKEIIARKSNLWRNTNEMVK